VRAFRLRSTPCPQFSGAFEQPLWRGDYETGDLSQWDGAQEAARGRIAVVTSPVAQGRYAARFDARQGESTGGDRGSNRSELVLGSTYKDHVGDERWYSWHTMLAPDFPVDRPNDFVSIMQWKRDDNQNPLPLGFGIHGRNLRIASNGTRYLGPISRGVWHRFLVHAKWSPDPRVGFLEVCMDDRLILPRTFLQNAYRDRRGRPIEHYIKQGLYKSDRIRSTWVVHDGMVIGATRAAVEG
jgi:hypothetical protein